MSEWINVDDKLPNEEGNDGLILVCCDGVVQAGFYDHWDKFSDGEGYSFFGKVTHWQPLPAPPQD